MSCPRSRTRSLMIACLGVESLGHNLELDIYNACIDRAIHECIPRHWECKAFRRLYTSKARSMLFNLNNSNNPALREAVLSRKVSTQRLVTMTHVEMFPKLWEKAIEYVAEKRLRSEIMMFQSKDVPDGLIPCKRCKSNKTVYFQMQTRSADEPMTTFCTCIMCDLKWKF